MPSRFRPIELLPGLLGAAVGFVVGGSAGYSAAHALLARPGIASVSQTQWDAIVDAHEAVGALFGFIVGTAFVALAHRLGQRRKKPTAAAVEQTAPDLTPDETVWPPPPTTRTIK